MKILLIGLFLSSSLLAADCFRTQTKIIFDGKEELSKETLCRYFTPDKMLFYVSQSCVERKCSVLAREKKALKVSRYKSNIGSPGFKLCFELEGIPQIFEYKDQKDKWNSTERCLFGKKDFVEISLLTYEWKDSIISSRP